MTYFIEATSIRPSPRMTEAATASLGAYRRMSPPMARGGLAAHQRLEPQGDRDAARGQRTDRVGAGALDLLEGRASGGTRHGPPGRAAEGQGHRRGSIRLGPRGPCFVYSRPSMGRAGRQGRTPTGRWTRHPPLSMKSRTPKRTRCASPTRVRPRTSRSPWPGSWAPTAPPHPRGPRAGRSPATHRRGRVGPKPPHALDLVLLHQDDQSPPSVRKPTRAA